MATVPSRNQGRAGLMTAHHGDDRYVFCIAERLRNPMRHVYTAVDPDRVKRRDEAIFLIDHVDRFAAWPGQSASGGPFRMAAPCHCQSDASEYHCPGDNQAKRDALGEKGRSAQRCEHGD